MALISNASINVMDVCCGYRTAQTDSVIKHSVQSVSLYLLTKDLLFIRRFPPLRMLMLKHLLLRF